MPGKGGFECEAKARMGGHVLAGGLLCKTDGEGVEFKANRGRWLSARLTKDGG